MEQGLLSCLPCRIISCSTLNLWSVNNSVVPFVPCDNYGCSVPASISVAYPFLSSLLDLHMMESIAESVSHKYLGWL